MKRLAAALARRGALPAGQWRLRLMDLVGAQAIEEIVLGVEGADVFEAQELPAAFAAGRAVRYRRTKFAGLSAPRMVAQRRVGAFDAAVQALAASRRVG